MICIYAVEAPMDTAKLFWTGRSQAVRLPKAFRIDADEVRIRRHGAAVILEPVPQDWTWLEGIAGRFSDDFLASGREQPAPQQRPALDHVFD
jgi:antitoxin VapB